jgi:splicing factor 3B subunit 2
MASVVSTVAAGLETPDFLELRKTTAAPVRDEGGNRQLYSVLPEKQTSVRGLMGSERGYDISGVVAASVPVLGDERGTKVRSTTLPRRPLTQSYHHSAQGRRRRRFPRCERARRIIRRRAAEALRCTVTRECGSAWSGPGAGGLLRYGRERNGEEATEDGG